MRIVGGALRGRRLFGPSGRSTRPTSERAREAIASALEARSAIEGAHVLDLFAGTGALAFEALSRGARSAVLAERDRKSRDDIARSAAALGLDDRVRVVSVDLLGDPQTAAARIARATESPFGLVFIDPPYEEIDRVRPLVEALANARLFEDEAFISLEHAARRPPSELEPLFPLSSYRHGEAVTLLAALRHRRDGSGSM